MSNGLLYSANYNSFTNAVSLVDRGGNVICEFDVPNVSSEFALKALENNSSVSLGTLGAVANTFEVNTGSGWTAYTFGTTINLNKGEVCKWRCSNYTAAQSQYIYTKFSLTGAIKAYGNIASLLSSNYENITSLAGYPFAFNSLFFGCRSLKVAPELPFTTLSERCYDNMFNDTGIIIAPELPATTVGDHSCTNMFANCTSLVKVPATLPATTLGNSCFSSMFYRCTSLRNAPEILYTGVLPDYACEGIFINCPINEVRIWATGKGTGSLKNWLDKVAASGTVYADPSLTLTADSVSGVPSGWTREDINNYPN